MWPFRKKDPVVRYRHCNLCGKAVVWNDAKFLNGKPVCPECNLKAGGQNANVRYGNTADVHCARCGMLVDQLRWKKRGDQLYCESCARELDSAAKPPVQDKTAASQPTSRWRSDPVSGDTNCVCCGKRLFDTNAHRKNDEAWCSECFSHPDWIKNAAHGEPSTYERDLPDGFHLRWECGVLTIEGKGCFGKRRCSFPNYNWNGYIANFLGKCWPVHRLAIGEGVTEIGNQAFRGIQPSAVEFPSSLREIYEEAFDCTNLSEIVLNEGLERVGYRAFSASKGVKLKRLVIPASLRDIGCSRISAERIELDENSKTYTLYDGCLYSKDKSVLVLAPAGYTPNQSHPAELRYVCESAGTDIPFRSEVNAWVKGEIWKDILVKERHASSGGYAGKDIIGKCLRTGEDVAVKFKDGPFSGPSLHCYPVYSETIISYGTSALPNVHLNGMVFKRTRFGLELVEIETKQKSIIIPAKLPAPLVKISPAAFENADPKLKVQFEKGFKTSIWFDSEPDPSEYSIHSIPGFKQCMSKQYGNYVEPSYYTETRFQSQNQTLVERSGLFYGSFGYKLELE